MSTDKTANNALQQPMVIPGWSKEDKFKLYTAVREFGSNNITSISTYVQKSPHDVRQAIEMYKLRAKACDKRTVKTKPVPVRSEPRNIPLDNWARLIMNMNNSNPAQLQSETSNAIKLIAEHESLPKPSTAENINFKDIYLLLADAMEGKPLKANSLNQYLIQRCIIDTAHFSKTIAKRIDVAKTLEKAMAFKVEDSDCGGDGFFHFTEDLETTIMRRLSSLEAYNPLNIPMDSLKTALDQEIKLLQKKDLRPALRLQSEPKPAHDTIPLRQLEVEVHPHGDPEDPRPGTSQDALKSIIPCMQNAQHEITTSDTKEDMLEIDEQ